MKSFATNYTAKSLFPFRPTQTIFEMVGMADHFATWVAEIWLFSCVPSQVNFEVWPLGKRFSTSRTIERPFPCVSPYMQSQMVSTRTLLTTVRTFKRLPSSVHSIHVPDQISVSFKCTFTKTTRPVYIWGFWLCSKHVFLIIWTTKYCIWIIAPIQVIVIFHHHGLERQGTRVWRRVWEWKVDVVKRKGLFFGDGDGTGIFFLLLDQVGAVSAPVLMCVMWWRLFLRAWFINRGEHNMVRQLSSSGSKQVGC